MTALSGEIELKLWLRPEDVEVFPRLPRLRHARPRELELRTIYFDTPDFDLAGRGIALRVRAIGNGWVQTLKTEGDRSGGLSRRMELESPVNAPLPDFSRLPAALVDRLVRGKWRSALAAAYETRFHRTAWNLRAADGSRVEVALDVGVIVAGEASEAINEVELELKSGNAEVLYMLAQTFMQQVLLVPFDASKAERGTRLARGETAHPLSAFGLELEAGLPVCAAFAGIARACLGQFQANLPGVLTDQDPEYLHQARVSVRRLRSAIGVFKKVCPPPQEEVARIADLGRALGAARDWDVFVLDTLPSLLEQAPAAQKILLVRRAHAARRKAREAALHLLGRPQTAADLLAMHRWLDRIETSRGGGGLTRFARKKLSRLHALVLAGAAGFAGQTPERRHLLRIRVKRLRYTIDYLGSLFGGHKKFAACFATLQDELGALNDINTALGFLKRLNHDGRLDTLVEQATGGLERHMQDRIMETDVTLQKFSRLQPPW
jgi:inorganic triphosphatase YgiF